jgi:GINS complex subunit 4
MRSQSPLASLRVAWVLERCAPELLPFQAAIVNDVQSSIHAAQSKIDNDEIHRPLLSIHQMDVDRASFVLASYLRTRLAKLQKFITYYLADESRREKLSAAELEFAQGYNQLVKAHLTESFLQDIPEQFRGFDADRNPAAPNVNRTSYFPRTHRCLPCFSHIVLSPADYVVARIKADLGTVQLSGAEQTLRPGSILVARYSGLMPYLMANQAELV